MARFEPLRDEIRAAGSLLFVAAEKRGGLFKPEKYLADHPVSFPFLLDEDRAVTKSYGVYHRIGLDAYNIARPATFLIGPDGVVRYIHLGANQYDRADIGEIWAALKQAKS